MNPKKECAELKEPFKVCMKNAKPEPLMSSRSKRMLRREPKFHIHVESDDPCLLLRVCHDIMTALEDSYIRRPEVAFDDVSFVQKTIDESPQTALGLEPKVKVLP